MDYYPNESVLKKLIPPIKTYENEYDIKCPFCNSKNFKLEDEMLELIDITMELTEDDYRQDADCICCNCDRTFLVTARLEFIREVDFEVKGKLQPEDIIKDYPGQSFFWSDLEPNGIRIY